MDEAPAGALGVDGHPAARVGRPRALRAGRHAATGSTGSRTLRRLTAPRDSYRTPSSSPAGAAVRGEQSLAADGPSRAEASLSALKSLTVPVPGAGTCPAASAASAFG